MYKEILELTQSIDDTDEEAAIPGSIGIAYFYLGDFDAAMEYYKRSLKSLQEIGDRWRIGNRLGNIANVYSDMSDYPKALTYFDKAMKIREELGDRRGLAADLNNTGLVYDEIGNFTIFEIMLIAFVYLRLKNWSTKIHFTIIYQFSNLMMKLIYKRSFQIFLCRKIFSQRI